jgi:surfactin synthase thioesterase subunit
VNPEIRADIEALADYGYRTSDIEAELIVAQADQIIVEEQV